MNTPPSPSIPVSAGLHPRLTVLQAGDDERAARVAELVGLLNRGTRGGAARGLLKADPADLADAAQRAAERRVDDHARTRDELTTKLRRAREMQAVGANRRDEAAARVRRMSAHLADCDALLERSGDLTRAAEQARHALEARRAEVDTARAKLSLVEEQREAAADAIEDASSQLADLEPAELDETALRRELEQALADLRTAEHGKFEADSELRAVDQAAAARAAARDELFHERSLLVARLEAPRVDTEPVRAALAAFDAETATGEANLAARELAREWTEVASELERIETALPPPPSQDELHEAEWRLAHLEHTIEELEAADRQVALSAAAHDEIEAAHEAVLAAEEELDITDAHPDAVRHLEEARQAEHAVLGRHGFETYLDVILAQPRPGDDAQGELLEAFRARRVAEDTLASLRAACEPPAIVLTLRGRQERIHAEAADLLGCDPGDNVPELLYAHPVVPDVRTRTLAHVLADHDVYPVGISLRDAASEWLAREDRAEIERDELRKEIDAVDAEVATVDAEEAAAADERARAVEQVAAATAEVRAVQHRAQTFERELADRSAGDERRLQRVAAAEQLRAQIAAVTEALDHSNEEYHSTLAAAETAATAAEATVERAGAALSDAVRRLRRIAEALPPALRPRAGDDPLGELPRLRHTLAGEVDRAELALAGATGDLERARTEVAETQTALDEHTSVVPDPGVHDDDILRALRDIISIGECPVVLDDPFTELPDLRTRLLDELVSASSSRPVVLLTSDTDTLGWAIGLPADIGAVTRLASTIFDERAADEVALAAQPTPGHAEHLIER